MSFGFQSGVILRHPRLGRGPIHPFLLVLVVFLSACASVGAPGTDWIDDLPATGTWPAQARKDVQQARSTADSEKSARLVLQAIKLALDGEKTAHVQSALRVLDTRKLSGENAVLRGTLHARLALLDHHPADAVQYLDSTPDAQESSLRTRWLRLRVRATHGARDWQGEVAARVRLAPSLPGKQKRANQKAIWRALQHLPFDVVARPPPRVQNLDGWYALAYLVKADQGEPYQLAYDLQLWQSTYPHHPANHFELPRLRNSLPQTRHSPAVPRQLALLLPLTGSLAPAGHAVLKGFRWAGAGTGARVYDTASSSQGAVLAYRRALASGADWLVGPLGQNAVVAVARLRSGRITELALNSAQPFVAADDGLYQFILGPKAQVRTLAQRALARGQRRAAVLYVDTPWGQEAADDFASVFQKLGGRIIASRPYPHHGKHLGTLVRRFLRAGPGGSLWRDHADENAVDMLFLVADPQDGRMLKPLLRYYHAVDLPVYATARLLSGRKQPRKNRDLDGITFCAMPFMLSGMKTGRRLRAMAHQRAPDLLRDTPRLLALGADAALLARRLHALRSGQSTYLNGLTGRLVLASDRRILRRLSCARFQDGVPELLPVSLARKARPSR